MEKVSIFLDQEGHSLTVWFGDRTQEYVCEETGDEVILMKNQQGEVIGFEKLNYHSQTDSANQLNIEAVIV